MCAGTQPQGLQNPDEMETQVAAWPGLPQSPSPSCLEAVVAALQKFPPTFDYTVQYKANFKALLQSRKRESGSVGRWRKTTNSRCRISVATSVSRSCVLTCSRLGSIAVSV